MLVSILLTWFYPNSLHKRKLKELMLLMILFLWGTKGPKVCKITGLFELQINYQMMAIDIKYKSSGKMVRNIVVHFEKALLGVRTPEFFP